MAGAGTVRFLVRIPATVPVKLYGWRIFIFIDLFVGFGVKQLDIQAERKNSGGFFED